MKRHPFRWAVLASIVASCGLCFVVQSALWDFLVSRKARLLSANTYTITLSRLQNASLLAGNTVMLGSSITERLMPSDDVVVIGVPGSSFLAGMQLVPYENVAEGAVFVLEANNLFNSVNEDVMAETSKPGFRLFRGSRHFSIAAMPSSLILSWMYYMSGSYARTLNDRGLLSGEALLPSDVSSARAWSESEQKEYAALCEGVRELRARGYRVCLFYSPERQPHSHDAKLPRLMSFAREMDVPLLDYTRASFVSELILTDDKHLDSKALSTTRFRNTVVRDARNCAR